MMADAVRLLLSEEGRASLERLLAAALDLAADSRVVDHLPANPWGDLDEFRSAIYGPLHSEATGTQPSPEHTSLTLEQDEVIPVKDVLDGLAEAFSGGNPWVALTDQEREVIEKVLARLGSEE